VLILGGFGQTHSNWASKQLTAVLQMPMSSFYAALTVCGVFADSVRILNLLDVLKEPTTNQSRFEC